MPIGNFCAGLASMELVWKFNWALISRDLICCVWGLWCHGIGEWPWENFFGGGNCGHSSGRVFLVDCLEPTSKYGGWELKNWVSLAVFVRLSRLLICDILIRIKSVNTYHVRAFHQSVDCRRESFEGTSNLASSVAKQLIKELKVVLIIVEIMLKWWRNWRLFCSGT